MPTRGRPRGLRHSLVSLLPDSGVPIEPPAPSATAARPHDKSATATCRDACQGTASQSSELCFYESQGRGVKS